MTGDEYMQVAWAECRDAGVPAIAAARAVARAFLAIGVFTAEIAELWDRRLETCPGHEGEGGRDWCAYCGNMPRGPIESKPLGAW